MAASLLEVANAIMRGFSLLEVLVATGVLVSALIALAQLFAIATASNLSSRNTTYVGVLAGQKMEELRGLAWGFDRQGTPVSDFSSDTAVTPESPAGGTGLNPSPGNALEQNTAGYVDYVDIFGNKLPGGSQPPRGAIYARRWAIEALPGNPDTLVIQVRVLRSAGSLGGASQTTTMRRLPDEARVATLKTRKAR